MTDSQFDKTLLVVVSTLLGIAAVGLMFVCYDIGYNKGHYEGWVQAEHFYKNGPGETFFFPVTPQPIRFSTVELTSTRSR